MNSYEINILFKSESEAESVYRLYDSEVSSSEDYLETAISKIFDLESEIKSKEFNIDLFKNTTNEIQIYCYGTKYPSLSLLELFKKVKTLGEAGIKLKTKYDDGETELHYIVNSLKCSMQKFNGFYKKTKIQDSTRKKAVKKSKPASPKDKVVPINDTLKVKKDELLENLDYGKDRGCKTAIIRLLVRGKAKRDRVRSLFESFVKIESEDQFVSFSKSFDQIVTSEKLIVNWCQCRKPDKDVWFKAPEKLIYGLIFVVEQDNYLYLGFDLEGLDLHEDRPVDKDLKVLIYILDAIDGVNKTWIKYRLGKNTTRERYVYYPDAGREPQVMISKLTEDHQWPS